jgi:hypothetical protein
MGSIDSERTYSPPRPSHYILRPPKFKAYQYTNDLSTEIVNCYGYMDSRWGWLVYGNDSRGNVMLSVPKDHWVVLTGLGDVLEILSPAEFDKKYVGIY